MSERFTVFPCGPESDGLFVIWDRQEEQVIDVMTREEVEIYALEPDL
jgi:hypothetical protein